MKMDVNRPVFTMYLLALLMALCKATLAKDTTLDDAISKSFRETRTTTTRNHLSRKRRYLQFPEGSSFQLVYDLVVGVVDYSNYITVSLTMALAYHLPSHPSSELLEDVKDRLRDGTFGVRRNDTATNIKYADVDWKLTSYNAHTTIPWYRYNMTFDKYYRHSAPKSNNYFTPSLNPLQHYFKNAQQLKYTISNAVKSPWSSSRLRPSNPNNMWNFNRISDGIKLPPHIKNLPNHHRIYSILGKGIGSNTIAGSRRAIANDIPSKLDRIHIRHQRSTRHNLYNAIETYLDRFYLNCLLISLLHAASVIDAKNGKNTYNCPTNLNIGSKAYK